MPHSDTINDTDPSDTQENDFSSQGESYSGEQLWYGHQCEGDFDELSPPLDSKKCIGIGDTLPYGIRMYTGLSNVFRLKDVGVKSRILIVGVIGSFTPICWNYHLLEVLIKFRYFEERGIDYICCISTNDSFTQAAWAIYLGCNESIIMVGDTSKAFTKAIGMDIIVPWLDDNVRSKRYVIYAEDMVVTKILVAPVDDVHMNWRCEHLSQCPTASSEGTETESESLTLSW